MLFDQIARVQLIERLVSTLWNIGIPGWGSGFAKSSKIIMSILTAIIENKTITFGPEGHVSLKKKPTFPFELVNELRAAGITWADIDTVKQNRINNINLIIEIAVKMLDRNFKDYMSVEHYFNSAISGHSTYCITAEESQRLRNANIIKFDFAAIFVKSRLQLMLLMSQETDFSIKEVFVKSIGMTDQTMDTLGERLQANKHLIEADFNRLKKHNLTAADVVNDLISISQDAGSKYSHIRPPQYVMSFLDGELIKHLGPKMIPLLDKKYEEELKSAPAPEPVHVKTPEEIAAEEQVRVNAIETVKVHFNMEDGHALDFVNRTPVNDLRSLWHIKMNIMPRVVRVLEALTESYSGNVQMVEDIVTFEQLVWSDPEGAWTNYTIPVWPRRFENSRISNMTNEQSLDLMSLKKELTLDLIRPLRENLTRNYKLRHPNETVLIGRDINKFKELAYFTYQMKVPEYMYNHTNVIAVLNDTEIKLPMPVSYYAYDTESLLPPASDNDSNNYLLPPRNGNQPSFLLVADLIMITILLGFLANTCRRYYSFFHRRSVANTGPMQLAEYAEVEESDDDERTTLMRYSA